MLTLRLTRGKGPAPFVPSPAIVIHSDLILSCDNINVVVFDRGWGVSVRKNADIIQTDWPALPGQYRSLASHHKGDNETMQHTIITPCREEFLGQTDSETIQNAVNYAHEKEINSVTIPRLNPRTGEPIWHIEKAIIIPSDMEVILDNCHLRQQDGCFDNIFRNFEDTEREGHTLAEQAHNIIIRGVGHAVLDGGNHNGLTQPKSLKDGNPHISRNNLIMMYNVRDFVIENLELRDQRYWAINLVHAERGRLSQLHIAGDNHCRNQDGIDLRVGCSNILIEKITGQAGDDIIALSAIGNRDNLEYVNYVYRVEGHEEDIHDIVIRDIIATSVECSVIALRNCDGRKLHDVTIDNVHCNDNYAWQDGKHYPEYPKYKIRPFDIVRLRKSNTPYALLRVGQPGYHKDRDSEVGELYNIHVTNLHMHMGCVILANCALKNCYFGNLYAGNDVDYILTTKEARSDQLYGADMENVYIENVFYDNRDNDFATAFDFDINRRECKVNNVIINRAFLGNCKKIFHIACDGQVEYTGLRGSHVENENGVAQKA